MLVLSRHEDESIQIGKEIKVTVIEIRGDKVRLGFDAPNHVKILRTELLLPDPLTEDSDVDDSERPGLLAYVDDLPPAERLPQ